MVAERRTLSNLVDPGHTMVLVVDVQPLFTGMPLRPSLTMVAD